MKDLNTVFLMGNLTRDPELRYTPNGQAVANFAIATNRQWKDQSGEQQNAVEYTDIVVWGKMAETVTNYMKKGQRIHVTGRLQTRSWEAQDGSKRQKTEVIATDIIFLGKSGGSDTSDFDQDHQEDFNQVPAEDKKEKSNKENDNEEEVDIEDIPF